MWVVAGPKPVKSAMNAATEGTIKVRARNAAAVAPATNVVLVQSVVSALSAANAAPIVRSVMKNQTEPRSRIEPSVASAQMGDRLSSSANPAHRANPELDAVRVVNVRSALSELSGQIDQICANLVKPTKVRPPWHPLHQSHQLRQRCHQQTRRMLMRRLNHSC
jgi:hypothetical protein